MSSYQTLMNNYINLTNKDHQLNEILDYLDNNQHSPEELQALKDMVNHQQQMVNTDEWEENSVFSKEDINEIDHQEMIPDMYAFEDENKTHELFANSPWESRNSKGDVTKKSETIFVAEITKKGDNYYTGISDYGKVYIPKSLNCDNEDTIKVRARFQGFEGCRKTSLPWRAMTKL
jgi:hypothetical protein